MRMDEHPPGTFIRRQDCRDRFSVRKGTAMRFGAPGLRKWTVALYMMVTGIKGTASTRAYRSSG